MVLYVENEERARERGLLVGGSVHLSSVPAPFLPSERSHKFSLFVLLSLDTTGNARRFHCRVPRRTIPVALAAVAAETNF